MKLLRDSMGQFFDTYGDDIMVEEDEDGNTLHVYFNVGTHEGMKHYECCGCGSGFFVEEKEIDPHENEALNIM